MKTKREESEPYKLGAVYKLCWFAVAGRGILKPVSVISKCIKVKANGAIVVDDMIILEGNTTLIDGWDWPSIADMDSTESCMELPKEKYPEYYL